MKKILSQSPFFLIFFGILGYLMYSYNFDQKMKKLNSQVYDECYEEVGSWKYGEEEYIEYLERVFPCRKRKWEELGLYDRWVNWSVNRVK